jgi:hypothetical protein
VHAGVGRLFAILNLNKEAHETHSR